ncbi:hypothetical protein Vafri_14960 [Volvox africanus]|uniref:Uncharacterized protein n=1 Tax=Volvox africanus TaxID=51714 RepID=A0A8J4F454_9CHLO|nr:hypothetical protein Vafri_14960 [Volvox africanus]
MPFGIPPPGHQGYSGLFNAMAIASHMLSPFGTSRRLPFARRKVTEGMETLRRMEDLPTKREGIFVMPLKRVTILATYWYRINHPEPSLTMPDSHKCEDELAELVLRFKSQAEELQRVRKKCLPV